MPRPNSGVMLLVAAPALNTRALVAGAAAELAGTALRVTRMHPILERFLRSISRRGGKPPPDILTRGKDEAMRNFAGCGRRNEGQKRLMTPRQGCFQSGSGIPPVDCGQLCTSTADLERSESMDVEQPKPHLFGEALGVTSPAQSQSSRAASMAGSRECGREFSIPPRDRRRDSGQERVPTNGG